MDIIIFLHIRLPGSPECLAAGSDGAAAGAGSAGSAGGAGGAGGPGGAGAAGACCSLLRQGASTAARNARGEVRWALGGSRGAKRRVVRSSFGDFR